ncbi:MAG: hypothetical protein IPK21_07125 [Haliscomenobacter sp.]|nr:hypothetical protein [Haliscomenobacter sp.]
MDHYTDYSSFTGALIGFVQQARSHGFPAGIQCSCDAVATALHGIWWDLEQFEFALAALFLHGQRGTGAVPGRFDRFWKPKGSRVRQKTEYKTKSAFSSSRTASR